jgi:NADH dehydrogenase
VQPIHVDDLATALVQIAIGNDEGLRLYQLGAQHPVTFATYLVGIARYRLGRRLIVIPLPIFPILALTKLLGSRSRFFGMLSERLAGLTALAPMDSHNSLTALGLTLRGFEAALQRDAAAAHERQQ